MSTKTTRKSKPPASLSPEAWIRQQRHNLEKGAMEARQTEWVKQRMANAFDEREIVQAFAPIAEYIKKVAQAGVFMGSYGPEGMETVMLPRVAPHAVGYQVQFETGQGPFDSAQMAWGFGVSAIKAVLGVRFEVYDFGGGRASSVQRLDTAKEALDAFMAKVEAHTVAIEAPGA